MSTNTPDPPSSPAAGLHGERIVCFSTADWDTLLPTNKHQLMQRLARRNRVLYLETLGTRSPRMASGTDWSRIVRRLQRGFEGPRKRQKDLWTLSPLVRPAWGSAIARAINRLAFRMQVVPKLGRFAEPIAWVYSPYAVYLLDLVQPKLVVYHMVDDLAAVPGANRRALREAEARLLARADVVICTERGLYDRARRVTSHVHFMPNVGDYDHFAKPGAVRDARLEKLRTMTRPRLVFSGNLAPHKVNLALLGQLVRARPDWNFVLIGPRWEGSARANALLDELARQPNAHLLGHVPYADLPAYLHEADVLMIPYVENAATRAVFPLKFFEYLATGRPVVATPLPSLLPFKEAAHLCRHPKAWEKALDAALADPATLRDQRLTLAARYTWDNRLAEMEAAVIEAMGE